MVSQLRIQSYSGERAVSFKKVSLPELLVVAPKATMASVVPMLLSSPVPDKDFTINSRVKLALTQIC